MRLFVLVPLLAVLAVSGLVAQAAEKAQRNGQKLDYRKLVEGLVSPNRPISCENGDSPTISLPPRFDWKAQERIEENRRLLFDHCEEALPLLIEACTDARYSLTTRWTEDDDFYNFCVGEVCSEIISHHVEAGFRQHIEFEGPTHWHRYNLVPIFEGAMTDKEKRVVQEWWSRRKGMTVRELQLAAFDWAIEKRRGELKELSDPEQTNRGEDEIKNLTSAREALSRDNKSLPPRRMWRSLVGPPRTHKIVPWSEDEK
jgi:hypothetical protein